MTSFVRRFSLSTSPTQDQISSSSPSSSERRKSSTSNGRILGARDYKLASNLEASSSPPRRRSSVLLEVTAPSMTNPSRVLGARDYQQAISTEDMNRRRLSAASTLVENKRPLVVAPVNGAVEVGDGRIYGARDYKLLARKRSGS